MFLTRYVSPFGVCVLFFPLKCGVHGGVLLMGVDQIPGEIVDINIGGIAHANCIIILNGKVVILIFGDRERRQSFAIFITNDLVVFTYIDSFR